MAASINVKILGDASSLVRSFNKAERSAAGFNRSMTKSGTSTRKSQGVMRGLGSSVRLAGASFLGGAGIVAGITSTLKKTAEFEQSLNTFQAVSGATATQMKAVGAQAQKLGSDFLLPGTSAKDAAEAMLELSKAGLSVPQVQKAVRSTLLLSAAAGVDNARAAEIASNTLNAFNINAAKTPKIVDVLAGAANASSVEIDDVALSFQQAGAVFSSFQGKALGSQGALKELAIDIGLLGNAGIKGSDAGTSLKQMMIALAAPVAKTKNLMRDLLLVTGGNSEAQRLFQTSLEGSSKKIRDDASTALEKLQGSSKGAGDIAYDAAGKMRPLHEIITRLGAATRNMTEDQRNWTVKQIFGSDASRAAIILLNKQGAAYDKMSAAVNKNGTAAAIAKAKQKGLAGAMDALRSAVESVQIMIGTTLAPAITKYLQASAKWLGDSKNQKTILGALKSTLAGIATVLHVIRAAFHALSVVVGGNKNAVKALIGALVVLKVTMLGLGIAGRVAAFRSLTGATRTATAATVAQGNAAKGAAAKGALLRRSLVGKAGIVGAAGVAAFALTTLVLKVTGLDKKLKAAGGAAFDLASKLGLADKKGKQFEGKKILTGAESRKIRQQAARLEAGGLSPQQATNRILKSRPNLARRDVEVLAGVHGTRPIVVHTHVNLDGHKVAVNTTKHQTARRATSRRG